MCGRFIMIPKDELARILAEVKRNLAGNTTNPATPHPGPFAHDVFPDADEVPIIVLGQTDMEIATMKWGYPKSWGDKRVVFNTRDDSVGKAMWANSFQNRRCLVPSYGFYEPHKSETKPSPKTGKPIKQQYLFRLPSSNVLMMGGIYQEGHFSIMTTTPNQWVEPVHNRMPVVLRPHEYTQWLHGDYPALLSREDVQLTKHPA